MTAHIFINGKEYELADVTEVDLAHTSSAGGTMVTLRTHSNHLLGYLNVGPGCFVTVGNSPTKASSLSVKVPNTEPIQAR